MLNFDWSNIGCVCFDVDSTVCVDEGLDELARYCGVETAVQSLTNQAMNGELDFTSALEMRLSIIKPDLDLITSFLRDNPLKLTDGIQCLVKRLHECGIIVCLVSGGFLPLVERVAANLAIPKEHVYCNRILFTEEGKYAGFDRSLPTTLSNGKSIVVGQLVVRFQTQVLIVGDGMTDARACPPAAAFVGFGGNADRPSVRQMTDYYCTTFDEMTRLFESKGLLKSK